MVFSKIKSAVSDNKASEASILAIDIGTEYIKIAMADFDDDNIQLIGVSRKRQGLQDMHAGAIADIEAVVDNCEEALISAEEKYGKSPTKCVMGLAGELVKGVTRTTSIKRADGTTPITAEEIETYIDKLHSKAKHHAEVELRFELQDDSVGVRLVNSAIVSIYIDGYKVSNPIGFEGSKIRIQLYTAFVPNLHIAALERVAQELDLELIAVAAEPFAVARAVIGNDESNEVNAILIDVGGGTTDIAVINESGVEGTKMFSIGGRSFTKSIASELGLPFSEAEVIKLKSDVESLTKPAQAALDASSNLWVSGVELALEEFTNSDVLPSRFLLCGGGSGLKNLQQTLKSHDWSAEVAISSKHTVSYIQPSMVAGFDLPASLKLDHSYITVLGLLRVGHDSLADGGLDEGLVKGAMRRILKV